VCRRWIVLVVGAVVVLAGLAGVVIARVGEQPRGAAFPGPAACWWARTWLESMLMVDPTTPAESSLTIASSRRRTQALSVSSSRPPSRCDHRGTSQDPRQDMRQSKGYWTSDAATGQARVVNSIPIRAMTTYAARLSNAAAGENEDQSFAHTAGAGRNLSEGTGFG
jgi:hypothetical protein